MDSVFITILAGRHLCHDVLDGMDEIVIKRERNGRCSFGHRLSSRNDKTRIRIFLSRYRISQYSKIIPRFQDPDMRSFGIAGSLHSTSIDSIVFESLPAIHSLVLHTIKTTMDTTTTTTNTTTTDIPSNANSGCVGPTSESAGTASACAGCPNATQCNSGAFRSPEFMAKQDAETMALKEGLRNVSHVVLVLSGKGGVGKSTVAVQLAHALAHRGYAVGVLDVDLCGPSAPRMLLGEGGGNHHHQPQQIRQSAAGHWLPVYTTHNNIAVLSISFLLSDTNAAVIWRGPRKNSLIQQFLTQTDWTGETDGLDYLIVDTPPGTSDEHISIVQYLARAQKIDGAIVVTTPEEASIADVRKELSFCQKTNVPVLGIVENMGTLQTDITKVQFYDNNNNNNDCTVQVLERLRREFPEIFQYQISTNLFTIQPGNAEKMAMEYGTEFWGRLPLDPMLLHACEHGQPFVVDQYPQSQAARALDAFAKNLVQKCPVEEMQQS